MSKPSGWQMHLRGAHAVTASLSTWEKLLRAESVREADALALIQTPDARGQRIVMWARKNHRKRYMPEVVIAALGLDEEEEARKR